MSYLKNKWICKKPYLILGLSHLKMVYQKTKIDSLIGLQGLRVIKMYFTVYMHILQQTLPVVMTE